MQAHALLVRLDGGQLRLTPYSGVGPDGALQAMNVQVPDGSVLAPPFVVRR